MLWKKDIKHSFLYYLQLKEPNSSKKSWWQRIISRVSWFKYRSKKLKERNFIRIMSWKPPNKEMKGILLNIGLCTVLLKASGKKMVPQNFRRTMFRRQLTLTLTQTVNSQMNGTKRQVSSGLKCIMISLNKWLLIIALTRLAVKSIPRFIPKTKMNLIPKITIKDWICSISFLTVVFREFDIKISPVHNSLWF